MMEINAATRALLIEDNPDDACLLEEALNEAKDASIELVHVEQLNDAAKLLKEKAFDVILLDLSLPDSRGIETVLRMQSEAPAVPIIVLTGLDDDNVALQAVRAGAQDYLVKGEINARSLVRAIRYASERKKSYEELSRLAQELTRALKVKDDFLSVISHELKTPLIAIMGYAQLLGGDSSREQTPEERAARVIREKSDELLKMIQRILEVVRIEAGQVMIANDIVRLTDLFSELSQAYSVRVKENVIIEWNCPGDLPKILIDGIKLRQILQHLIENAIKFTQEGRIIISVRHIAETDSLQFSVQDTGIGIPDDLLPLIFDKFHQADNSEKRDFEGMGLGLYIVKRFTEMLNGSIAVQSKLGNGSEFVLTMTNCKVTNGEAAMQLSSKVSVSSEFSKSGRSPDIES
jgi:signal transduction histidine kinase